MRVGSCVNGSVVSFVSPTKSHILFAHSRRCAVVEERAQAFGSLSLPQFLLACVFAALANRPFRPREREDLREI